MSKKTYLVKRTVHHDNVEYLPGKTIDLEEGEVAEALLTCGSISDGTEVEAAPSGNAPANVLSAEEKLAAVKTALGKLNLTDPDNLSGNGRPSASALTVLVGFTVTSGLRDQVWAEGLTDEEKLEIVKAEITKLNVDVKDNWTGNGSPNTSVLSAAAGFTVSGALRDQAWDLVKPGK